MNFWNLKVLYYPCHKIQVQEANHNEILSLFGYQVLDYYIGLL